ncbi:MAG TPA: 2-C-methyl-D-erythritol 2,4-cyclodiphosphate synthase [Spirochaetota bacterium]|nr:2-C-methyl-D-erythritol 2,4-cyclodiphosphate synthase [Spirochaetota bacterium]HOF01153.1 2-C-methyl-D-erythritol 2,4-cyclodiphosphate synthase [Spirochaetota bacterium]HOS33148.1 2-C-methyl-D-erythritol 2,4-cyclodiphosphate synthase [Spirochaetota bacterium]HOS54510.1 2-C-methyl-D-erythritol 2,4-cyclodiphosphate synthase [Spirochaetota bacterium]HPK61072.1 2-C-methyl-D-erythritol 2,4-cyclodiphosphate synthase [Spirochaetota bacterium]
MRIGSGYDIHKLVSKGKFILGNVEIPYNKGFLAHSDGDVLIHSIIDSLFGAANLGDIGAHFPDNDPKYKNIDSAILLKETVELIKERKYRIINIDSTIICQKPRLRLYIDSIKFRLSEIIGISVDRISVKAKTNEELDSVGKNRAVAVYTVSLLEESL